MTSGIATPGSSRVVSVVIIVLIAVNDAASSRWDQWWWTYDGISGPDWWGLLNQEWELCKIGRYQSPIDIQPDKLLFDPSLSGIVFTNDKKLNGNLTNTGNDITLFVEDGLIRHLNATSGPLQYTYHLHQIKIHFGPEDMSGSEHTVNGLSFPAELQIYAYNSDLYSNYSKAVTSPNGIAAFSIFLEIGEKSNEAFTMIADSLKDIPSRGNTTYIKGLPLNILLPGTPHYITYEGSFTQPGCHETVTWVIYNKPIYVNANQTKACAVAKQVFYEVNTLQPKTGR